jgi:hypothetical protein
MRSKALQPHQLPPAAAALNGVTVLLQAANNAAAAGLYVCAELCCICCAAFVQGGEQANVAYCYHELACEGIPATERHGAKGTKMLQHTYERYYL